MIHPLLRQSAAILLATLTSLHAQEYSYNPTLDPSGPQQWDNATKWGVNPYPSAAGIITRIERTATADTLSLNNLTVTTGQLRIGDGGTGTGSWTLNHGTLQLQGPAPEIYAGGATTYLRANLQAASGVTFTGPNTLLVTNTATRIGGPITISGGGHIYLYTPEMTGTGMITLSGNGSIRLGTGSGTATFANPFTLSGEGTTRAIVNNSAGSALTVILSNNITGNANLILSTEQVVHRSITELQGANSYTGSTEIRTDLRFHSLANLGAGALSFTTNARTLFYAASNTADLTTNLSGNARALTLNTSTTIDTGANHVTYTNAVSGSGTLVKSGNGSLTLQGNNTLGTYTISQGSLQAAHRNALGGATGNVTLKSDGELALAEGHTIEVGDLTLESGATFRFHLGANTTQLDITGDQSGSGFFEIALEAQGPLQSTPYTLMTFGANREISGFTLASSSNVEGQLLWDSQNGILSFQAVPEPSITFLLTSSAAALLLLYRRHR